MNLPRRTILAALPATAGLLGLGACSTGGATAQASSTAPSQAPTHAKPPPDSPPRLSFLCECVSTHSSREQADVGRLLDHKE